MFPGIRAEGMPAILAGIAADGGASAPLNSGVGRAGRACLAVHLPEITGSNSLIVHESPYSTLQGLGMKICVYRARA